MGDLLRMDYINSLPQPFIADLGMGGSWPVETIGVDVPFVLIDVCGKLQTIRMSDVQQFIDAEGVSHAPYTFWTDYEEDSHG